MKLRIVRSTKKQQLQELLDLLRPYNTGIDLIRLGGDSDGGYLVPNDLSGVANCFSPGVDVNSTFEMDCAEMGMEVYLADASVESPPVNHPKFHFTRNYVGGFSRPGFHDFTEWVGENVADGSDLMLQMDIEGCEYEVLSSIPTSLMSRFRIMVIEFHSLERILERSAYELLFPIFKKISQNHVCVHIHPNNYHDVRSSHGIEIPRLAEFTFLRRDRVQALSPASVFPHPLDRDCCKNRTLSLPKCWYKR
jgi:hypothetical protein